MIKKEFQKKFHDCVGCYIGFSNAFQVTLYFENNAAPIEAGKIKNLKDVTDTKGIDRRDLFALNRSIEQKQNGKTYELSEGTLLLLSDFMLGGRRAYPVKDKNKWRNVITERKIPASTGLWQPGAERVVLGVTNLDIRVICREIFGNKIITCTKDTPNGSVNEQTQSAFYEVRFAKALPDGSFMINIEQFDRLAVEEMSKAENPQFVQNNGVLMY